MGLVYVYFSFYQQVDEEEYGGVWELLKEGFMTSSAIFLVSFLFSSWLTFTPFSHFPSGFVDSNIHCSSSQLVVLAAQY